ncbi:hypothetical protein EMIHUDRAFT_457764 [Emiliania huxleyi CCMP1516]|uniref:Uncharacterized protein n=2 Tax=Emiliania huxleyi TaxID=2903 RepID=A0A0D3JLH4_EMIH1|nr:hypothetical protein EMIHUDRAFT_457764 [Emiliania huxleyi CCMP1516]EOD24359.1 hypothetical protein EMIHUDRAFT_457764 [Emiliania huxleyi CCMP1516]|eukprot:XP_005776788.1 hypothetical protein EMIHUDRAFT_457764 [Emiliania huxleyi CCMP1516]
MPLSAEGGRADRSCFDAVQVPSADVRVGSNALSQPWLLSAAADAGPCLVLPSGSRALCVASASSVNHEATAPCPVEVALPDAEEPSSVTTLAACPVSEGLVALSRAVAGSSRHSVEFWRLPQQPEAAPEDAGGKRSAPSAQLLASTPMDGASRGLSWHSALPALAAASPSCLVLHSLDEEGLAEPVLLLERPRGGEALRGVAWSGSAWPQGGDGCTEWSSASPDASAASESLAEALLSSWALLFHEPFRNLPGPFSQALLFSWPLPGDWERFATRRLLSHASGHITRPRFLSHLLQPAVARVTGASASAQPRLRTAEHRLALCRADLPTGLDAAALAPTPPQGAQHARPAVSTVQPLVQPAASPRGAASDAALDGEAAVLEALLVAMEARLAARFEAALAPIGERLAALERAVLAMGHAVDAT